MTAMDSVVGEVEPRPMPPLGEGILRLELRDSSTASLTATQSSSCVLPTCASTAGVQPTDSPNIANDPPPSPPALYPRSPTSSRKGSFRIQSMDDSYCDRIRSTSSFGWYDESTAFESIDVPQSTYREIEDWRDLNTWHGGRGADPNEDNSDAQNVQFEVPHAHVTTTKTFRAGFGGRPEAYTIAIRATRVIRVSAHTSHAEYQVMMSTNNQVYKMWKRFSDFKLLAEYAKISDLRESVEAWRRVQQTQRWFRCLDANYLKRKCNLLEKFLAQLLFEVASPSLLLTFVGSHHCDFKRR